MHPNLTIEQAHHYARYCRLILLKELSPGVTEVEIDVELDMLCYNRRLHDVENDSNDDNDDQSNKNSKNGNSEGVIVNTGDVTTPTIPTVGTSIPPSDTIKKRWTPV